MDHIFHAIFFGLVFVSWLEQNLVIGYAQKPWRMDAINDKQTNRTYENL